MTLTRLHETGFEFRTTGEVDFYFGGGYGSAPCGISTSNARTGSACADMGTSTAPTGKAISPSTTQVSGGYYFRYASFTGVSGRCFQFFLTGTYEIIVGLNLANNNLEMVVNGSVVDSVAFSSAIPSTNTYYALGLTAKADPTNGFVSFYVDGVQVLTYTGNTGSAISGFYFGGDSGGGMGSLADDFYVDDAVGEADVAPSSPRFVLLLPNGAGSYTNWTPSAGSNYQNVDDAGANDGDSTFNYATASGAKDAYAVTNTTAGVTVPAGHIVRAVTVGAIVRKTDAGFDSQIKLGIRDGSGNESVGSATTLPTSYTYRRNRHTTAAGGGAWSEAAVDNTQIVVESAGSFS